MTQEELKEVCQKWQEESEDRTAILITSEGKGHKRLGVVITGKKIDVELALYKFLRIQVELVKDATATGMVNDMLGNIMKEKNDGVSDNKAEGQE